MFSNIRNLESLLRVGIENLFYQVSAISRHEFGYLVIPVEDFLV
jgi:hypothetical protein